MSRGSSWQDLPFLPSRRLEKFGSLSYYRQPIWDSRPFVVSTATLFFLASGFVWFYWAHWAILPFSARCYLPVVMLGLFEFWHVIIGHHEATRRIIEQIPAERVPEQLLLVASGMSRLVLSYLVVVTALALFSFGAAMNKVQKITVSSPSPEVRMLRAPNQEAPYIRP